MKATALLFFVFVGLSWAGEVGVPLPPSTALPDTENRTNIVLGASVARTDVFSVALSLTATPSNNAELVFSEDAGEGRDSAFSIGWDCGHWFVEGPSNRFEALSPSPQKRDFSRGNLKGLRGPPSYSFYQLHEVSVGFSPSYEIPYPIHQ